MKESKQLLAWADELKDMGHDCYEENCCYYDPIPSATADGIEAWLRKEAARLAAEDR